MTPTPQQRLADDLRARLVPAARDWLDEALAVAAAEGADGTTEQTADAAAPLPAWELRFAAAGRHCGRAALADTTGTSGPSSEQSPAPPDPADAARVLLLHAARAGGGTAARLYAHGTAAERRAVLLALPYLDRVGDEGLPLVEDALRANDTRLVAAAVGPYAARHLDAHAWRHAVLKCLFTGVPVDACARLAERAAGDAELARMLTGYARERTAAGRPVPADLHRVLELTAAPARGPAAPGRKPPVRSPESSSPPQES